jgi:outer membrane cobalamin receptor
LKPTINFAIACVLAYASVTYTHAQTTSSLEEVVVTAERQSGCGLATI